MTRSGLTIGEREIEILKQGAAEDSSKGDGTTALSYFHTEKYFFKRTIRKFKDNNDVTIQNVTYK